MNLKDQQTSELRSTDRVKTGPSQRKVNEDGKGANNINNKNANNDKDSANENEVDEEVEEHYNCDCNCNIDSEDFADFNFERMPNIGIFAHSFMGFGPGMRGPHHHHNERPGGHHWGRGRGRGFGPEWGRGRGRGFGMHGPHHGSHHDHSYEHYHRFGMSNPFDSHGPHNHYSSHAEPFEFGFNHPRGRRGSPHHRGMSRGMDRGRGMSRGGFMNMGHCY